MLPKPPPFSTTYNFQEVQIGIQYLQWQNKCTLQSQVCQQHLEVEAIVRHYYCMLFHNK